MTKGHEAQVEPNSRARLLALLLTAAALAIAILLHMRGLDGPWYSHWGWRRTSAMLVYPAMLASAIPLFVALWLHEWRRIEGRWLLPLIMLSHFLFELVAVSLMDATSFSFDTLIKAVVHPDALSYFADASTLVGGPGNLRDWLSNYPDLLPDLFLHSRSEPPGPVMFFAAFISTLGLERSTALVSALAVAALATLVSPAVYFLCRALRMNAAASFYAGAWIVLMPSAVMFLPSLDVLYMLATCAFVGCWAHALRTNRFGGSIAFGAALMLTSFFVYNILVLGALIVGYALICAPIPPGRRMMRFLRHAAVVLLTVVALYGVLYVLTGFNPIATFAAAFRNQESQPAELNRQYRWTILFDQTDFALGAGWLAIVLVGMFLLRRRELESELDGPSRCFAWLAVTQIAITGFTGFLPGETARVWAFLVPLLMPMVGAELSRWSRAARLAAFVAAWVLLALLVQNLLEADFERMPLVWLRFI